MGLFTPLERFGNKVAHNVVADLKFGAKAVGTAAHYGHKVTHVAAKGVDLLSHVPIIGMDPRLQALKVGIHAVDAGLDRADKIGNMIGSAQSVAHNARSGVRAAQSAVRAGDLHQAVNIGRATARDSFAAGRTLQSTARSLLEKQRR